MIYLFFILGRQLNFFISVKFFEIEETREIETKTKTETKNWNYDQIDLATL